MSSAHYTYVLSDPRDGSVFYVGKGTQRRMHLHVWNVKRKNHCNPKLQHKISKILGLGLLPLCEKIFEHEDEWPCHANEVAAIAFYGRRALCNLTDGGEGSFGSRRSAEAIAKFTAANSGEKHWFFGKHHSAETKAKLSSQHVGMKPSTETRKKLSIAGLRRYQNGKKAHWFGKSHSNESNAKRSAAQSGEKCFWFGKRLTAEHKAKVSASRSGQSAGDKNPFFGKEHSPESRAKMSAAHQARIANKVPQIPYIQEVMT